MVVSGEQIPMRSTWVSNRGESPPQTKVTLKQLFDPPSRGGVQPVSGRRLGPQVAGGGGEEQEKKKEKSEETSFLGLVVLSFCFSLLVCFCSFATRRRGIVRP